MAKTTQPSNVLHINITYKPHKKQIKFHNLKGRYRAFIGGIGSGKTYAGCMEALRQAIKQPGSIGYIVAPTYPMLRDVTKRVFLELCPSEIIDANLKGQNKINLVNGSEVLFRSCDDPDRLRGPSIAWFYIDEASLVPDLVWRIMVGRLRQTNYKHMGWLTTTPKGFNWIYRRFAYNPKRNYYMLNCTSHENPYLEKDYLEDLEESYVGVFREQEIRGKFVAHEGLVYSNFSRDIHTMDLGKQFFKKYYFAIDIGFTNPTAVLVCGVDSDDRLFVVDEFYERRANTERIINKLKQFKEKYGVDSGVCDPSAAEFIYECKSSGFDISGGNNEIMAGINEVFSRLEVKKDNKPRLFIDRKCVNMIMEIENYSFPEKKEDKPEKENPIKIFDHALDSIRYLAMHLKKSDSFSVIESNLDSIF